MMEMKTNNSNTIEKLYGSIGNNKIQLREEILKECSSVTEYCKENIIDINNNIIDFKDFVKNSSDIIDRKFTDGKKDVERCRADFKINLNERLSEMDEVVQVKYTWVDY